MTTDNRLERSKCVDVKYSAEAAMESARIFRDYRLHRYGALMIGACIVNSIGVVFMLWFVTSLGTFERGFLAFLVIGCPLWLLYEHFVWPQKHASRLLRTLPSPGRVTLSSDSISIATVGREAVIPWSRIKNILETDLAFLLVPYPFMFLFIPKADLPGPIYDELHSRVA